MRLLFTYCLIYIFITSCNEKTKINSNLELQTWLADPSNGFSKNKIINGLKIKLNYIPNMISQGHKITADSLKIKESMTFILEIGFDEKSISGDVVFSGINNYEEFINRTYELNFYMKEKIYLDISTEQYEPSLCIMEQSGGISPSRKFIITFVPESLDDSTFYSGENIDFVFHDDTFKTGIHHFKFDRKDINRVPKINI